jgi:trehalose 6-phosphate phosphatase
MIYLFDRIKKVVERLRVAKRIFLFLDYDGALTPIVSQPEEAYLSGEMKRLLANLKRNPKILMAIVSGRSLGDIQSRIGLKGISYVGNHGLEVFIPKHGRNVLVSKKIFQELVDMRDRLNNQLRGVKGVVLEDKRCVLALHYRNVDPICVPPILMGLKKEINRSMAPLALAFGKYVFEVKPKSSVNKGVAVLELLNHVEPGGVLPIYIGDDQTDEDAFSALRRNGITVLVGFPRLSSARYYVKDPSEVFQFLKIIQKELRS